MKCPTPTVSARSAGLLVPGHCQRIPRPPAPSHTVKSMILRQAQQD